jgi:hypothetical protein
MINVIQTYLMIYACFDFFLQIVAQLPVIDSHTDLEIIGFRKIWDKNGPLNYETLINAHGNFVGLTLNGRNLIL